MNYGKSKTFKSIFSLLLAFIIAFCPLMLYSSASTLGDVDANGSINANDALYVLQHSTNTKTLSSSNQKLADVNSDGKVNSSDALDILRLAAGTNSGSTTTKKSSTTTKATTTKATTTKATTTKATTTKATTTKSSSTSYKATVTADPSLNLRSTNSTSGTKLTAIPKGVTITITEEKNGWGKTTYAGKTGWVSLQYITKGTTSSGTSGTSTGKSGTFTITCYGFGHGVGMSQWGAITYAEQGWTYDKILLHYYHSDSTKIVQDKNMPENVTFGSQTIPLKKYIACSTYAETGDSVSYESIKSLMVAIYTYAKYFNFKVPAGTHEYNSSYKWSGTAIEKAMNEVLGKYVSYNGSPALTVYCSSVGGKTTSSANAWGSSPAPAYLTGGRTSPEPESISKRVYTFTADEIKTLAKNNMGVTLTGDPSTWFTNIVHDKSVNSTTGYISSMKVGGTTIKGEEIRSKLFAYKIRSHCLNIKYNP